MVPLSGGAGRPNSAGASFDGESGNPHGVSGTDFLPRKTVIRSVLDLSRVTPSFGGVRCLSNGPFTVSVINQNRLDEFSARPDGPFAQVARHYLGATECREGAGVSYGGVSHRRTLATPGFVRRPMSRRTRTKSPQPRRFSTCRRGRKRVVRSGHARLGAMGHCRWARSRSPPQFGRIAVVVVSTARFEEC